MWGKEMANDFVQVMTDGQEDAKTLSVVVNGDEQTQVETRLGESYPSVKKAIKSMTQAGVGFTSFETKALMTASSLANGTYAIVTNDTSANNGLHLKKSGTWSKVTYDVDARQKEYADAARDLAISAAENHTENELGALDTISINSGKTYPLDYLNRSSSASDLQNQYFVAALLDAQVINAERDYYYKLSYLQNGEVIAGVSKNYGIIVERINIETGDTIRLIDYANTEKQVKPDRTKGGIQNFVLQTYLNTYIKLTFDVDKLPPDGTPIIARAETNFGYNSIISTDTYIYEPTEIYQQISDVDASATTKANDAKTQAVEIATDWAADDATSKSNDAITAAALDATNKANDAKTQAVAIATDLASSDATSKADSAKAGAINYTNTLPIYAVNDSPTSPSLNLYRPSDDVLGFYVNNTGRLGQAANTKIAMMAVNPDEGFSFDSEGIQANVISIAFSDTSSLVANRIVTIADVTTNLDGVISIVVPKTARYMFFNTLLPNFSYDVTSSLILNKKSTSLIGYGSASIADQQARLELESKVGINDFSASYIRENLAATTDIMGFYIGAAGANKGLVQRLADAAIRVFPITAGDTYAVYSANYNSSVFTIGVDDNSEAVFQKPTTVVTLTATAEPGVKVFTAPAGMKFAFITVLLPSFNFDIRDSLWVNKGSTSSRLEVQTTSMVNNMYFRDNDAQLRIDHLGASTSSRLKNKRWCVIGDSITERNARTSKNYHDFVAQDVGGMTVYNYGISGTGYFNRSNVADLVTQTDIDIITVFLGTNDFGNQTAENKKQLGVFLDTGTATISGCINTLLTGLLTKFSTKKIAVITPTPRLTSWGSNAANNAYGYTLEQLSILIKQYCQHYSLPCLDLYHESNLPVWMPASNTYYFTAPADSTPDGLHPNDAGHRVIADKVKSFLESI